MALGAAGTLPLDGTREPEDPTLETIELERCSPAEGWVLELGTLHGVRRLALESGQAITLGSGRQSALRLDDAAVSARHCLVRADELGVEVRDLGSRNGLFVGAARVEAARLAGSGANFVIGRTSVCVRPRLVDDSAAEAQALPGLVGDSAPMRRVARDVRRHAPLRAPVLLLGESGTGKDVVARALHDLSGRSGPHVPINAGAIAESLADAELFGHQRGAFTGAVSSRAGAFEQAHRGSLFLDEVAELSPGLQVRLLRVVEDGVIRPLGAAQPVRVDVRLISATWADLRERVRAERFRADLLHRLSTVVIELPPLRARRSDLPALCHVLLARLRDELGPRHLTSSALAKLVSYGWPGNVRELGSVLYRAAVSSDAEDILEHHIELHAETSGRSAPLSAAQARALLGEHRGNVSAAARSARVPRSTFRSWLDKSSNG
jgi:DNA-binding NtrC family response regulator